MLKFYRNKLQAINRLYYNFTPVSQNQMRFESNWKKNSNEKNKSDKTINNDPLDVLSKMKTKEYKEKSIKNNNKKFGKEKSEKGISNLDIKFIKEERDNPTTNNNIKEGREKPIGNNYKKVAKENTGKETANLNIKFIGGERAKFGKEKAEKGISNLDIKFIKEESDNPTTNNNIKILMENHVPEEDLIMPQEDSILQEEDHIMNEDCIIMKEDPIIQKEGSIKLGEDHIMPKRESNSILSVDEKIIEDVQADDESLDDYLALLDNSSYYKEYFSHKAKGEWNPVNESYIKDGDLTDRLYIFSKPELNSVEKALSTEESEDYQPMDLMNLLDTFELKQKLETLEFNDFDHMINLTKNGILWKYPIDNDQDSPEQDVSFHEHVFPQQYIRGKIEPNSLSSQFMNYVCLGLSQNPYLTVEQKKEHVHWFEDYMGKGTKFDSLVDSAIKKSIEKEQFREETLKEVDK